MTEKKTKIAIALKKARTSIDKILYTIESSKEGKCFETIQQNLAVIGLLRSVNSMMLEAHLDSYIDAMSDVTPSERKKVKKIRDEVVRIVHTAQNK